MGKQIHIFSCVLILSLCSAGPRAYENDPCELEIMSTPYRHSLISPLPNADEGVNIEEVILESAVANKPILSPEMDSHLLMVINALQRDDAHSVEIYWAEFIRSTKNINHHVDVNAVMYWAIQKAFLDTNSELSFAASRIKFLTEIENTINDKLNRERELLELQCSDFPDLCREIAASIRLQEEALERLNDDIRQSNTYWGERLNKYEEIAEALSNYIKELNEAYMGTASEPSTNDDDGPNPFPCGI